MCSARVGSNPILVESPFLTKNILFGRYKASSDKYENMTNVEVGKSVQVFLFKEAPP